MNVVRVVQGFGPAPDDRERRCNIRRPGCVRELHRVAVDGVAQQLGVDTGDSSFDIKLANKSRLDYKLSNNVHLHFDSLFNAGCHQYFRGIPHGCVDGWTKCRT